MLAEGGKAAIAVFDPSVQALSSERLREQRAAGA